MDSKERFAVTCGFGTPDRIPVDYLAHREADRKLKEYLGCKSEDELLERLGCDFYYLSCRDISQNESFFKCYRGPTLDITDKERTCCFGIRWLRGAYDSKFSADEALAGPLEKAESEKDIFKHRWLKVGDFDFSILLKECESHPGKVIIGGLWSSIMGDSYRLQGYQNFLMNLSLKPELTKTLINRVTDVYLELNDAVFSQLKGKMDVWFFGSDFGTQNGLLMSAGMWQEYFFQPIRRLVSLAHRYGLKVMMHSCGGIAQIIPYLIEAGVDILDPLQLTAQGMEPGYLAEKFGGKIVFHGGVDTQHVLPYRAPEEVRRHSREVISLLGRKGGYIFAPSQTLGPDIPVENMVAMYSTVNNALFSGSVGGR